MVLERELTTPRKANHVIWGLGAEAAGISLTSWLLRLSSILRPTIPLIMSNETPIKNHGRRSSGNMSRGHGHFTCGTSFCVSPHLTVSDLCPLWYNYNHKYSAVLSYQSHPSLLLKQDEMGSPRLAASWSEVGWPRNPRARSWEFLHSWSHLKNCLEETELSFFYISNTPRKIPSKHSLVVQAFVTWVKKLVVLFLIFFMYLKSM